MSYPRQKSVLARLEKETRSAMRRIENLGVEKLNKLWEKAKNDLRAAIAAEYRADFPRQDWTRVEAMQRGTLFKIERRVHSIMDAFSAGALEYARRHLAVTKREETLRAAWMLDQTTPPGTRVQIPTAALRESLRTGPAAAASWSDRWAAWVSAYKSNLGHNLGLGALNSSSVADAADEVDATRAGSPSLDLWDVMERLFRTSVIDAEAAAREDLAGENEHLDIEEIWQTIEDARVCDICDPLDGKTREDVESQDEETIPAHPYCRCYWRLVPKAWADLADEDIKTEMDARHLVPDAMLLRDADGKITGAVTVDFEDWRSGMNRYVEGLAK